MKLKSLWTTLSIIGISSGLTLGACLGYNSYLDSRLAATALNPAVVQPYVNNTRDNGLALVQKAAPDRPLFMLGSSELEIDVPQNPKNIFPNQQLPTYVFAMGRAYAQSLNDAMRLGAFNKEMYRGQRVVLVTSLQWFSGTELIITGQQARFSELQFYRTLANPSLDLKDKKYIAHRMASFLRGSIHDRACLYAALYAGDSLTDKVLLALMQPYYRLVEGYLVLKDKHQALKQLEKEPYTPEAKARWTKEPKKTDWGAEYAAAARQGQDSCTNNPFYVEDTYFNRWLKPNLHYLKDYSREEKLLESREWDDLQVLINVAKANGIDLYVVFMSTNGHYYDFTGMTKDKRQAFYQKLAQVMRKNQVAFLDTSDKEYVPYVYYDAMHLGWKGWLYVDEQIAKHYSRASR